MSKHNPAIIATDKQHITVCSCYKDDTFEAPSPLHALPQLYANVGLDTRENILMLCC